MYSPAQMRRRKHRVRVLLATHDEAYDTALGHSSSTAPGFADPMVRSYVCGVCHGAGCVRCEDGHVAVEERDPYDTGFKGAGLVQPEDEDHLRERLLERLRNDELKRTGVIADIPFEGPLRRAEARDRRGSYRELRACLDVMPRLLRGDVAVEWLAAHMPRVIRVPAEAYFEELELVAADVAELEAQGVGEKEIARELHVSRRQVRSLMRRKRV